MHVLGAFLAFGLFPILSILLFLPFGLLNKVDRIEIPAEMSNHVPVPVSSQPMQMKLVVCMLAFNQSVLISSPCKTHGRYNRTFDPSKAWAVATIDYKSY